MDRKHSQFKLRQTVDMNGEKKRFRQDLDVELIERKDRYYRYTEKLDEHEMDVVLRAGDGFVKIQRRGVINMNFHFEEGRTTETFYESPAGKHLFRIYTTRLDVGDGLVDIEYNLIEDGTVIGNYHYKLEKVG
ncbi:hypothetical protein WN59_04405 [Salinicoccus sediminis]|uniref:DUF1934 domain-containing protein n=1 Tax=Salinicoccus sediminis TaxID=1432562 RepID=A0A0M2SMM6_9STAP|nr:DUF1934 domain-containing protein [Salinicoccus sediminis]KKK34901.1 hypothetical protein WN59_04405 [Salinicoccus sediminis]